MLFSSHQGKTRLPGSTLVYLSALVDDDQGSAILQAPASAFCSILDTFSDDKKQHSSPIIPCRSARPTLVCTSEQTLTGIPSKMLAYG